MPETNEKTFPARVLRAGVIAGREVQPDDLVEVPESQVDALYRDGAIDPNEGAVAYARSLVAPASAERVLEGAEADPKAEA